MEELTPEELKGILEEPRSSCEDLRAAAQLSLRRRAEGRTEGLAEVLAEGRVEWQLLQQHLLTMSSHKFEIILDDMYQQLRNTKEQLRLKTRELDALMYKRSQQRGVHDDNRQQ